VKACAEEGKRKRRQDEWGKRPWRRSR
jgi:hypothetical protein